MGMAMEMAIYIRGGRSVSDDITTKDFKRVSMASAHSERRCSGMDVLHSSPRGYCIPTSEILIFLQVEEHTPLYIALLLSVRLPCSNCLLLLKKAIRQDQSAPGTYRQQPVHSIFPSMAVCKWIGRNFTLVARALALVLHPPPLQSLLTFAH
jgi:hypothetical protein